MEALHSIVNTISNPTVGKALTAGSGILGTIGNIRNSHASTQINQDAIKRQQLLDAIAKDPSKLAAMAARIQQPLSLGLTEGVGNDVQGILASRGLGTSPAIAEQITSQTIAPYEQHSQDTALQAIMQILGLGDTTTRTAAATVPQNTDTSAFWKMFQPSSTPSITLPSGGNSGSGGGGDYSPEGTEAQF